MFCKSCGAELPDGSKFCTACGSNSASSTEQNYANEFSFAPENGGDSPSGKNKTVIIAVIVAAGAAIVVAAIILAIVFLNGGKKDSSDDWDDDAIESTDYVPSFKEEPTDAPVDIVLLNETYTDDYEGFAFDHPSGWELMNYSDLEDLSASSGGEIIMVLLAPSELGQRANININKSVMDESFYYTKSEFQEAYSMVLGNGITVTDLADISLDGVPARKLTNRQSNSAGALVQMQYFYAIGQDLYCLTCTSPENLVDKYEPIFDMIIDSFQITRSDEYEPLYGGYPSYWEDLQYDDFSTDWGDSLYDDFSTGWDDSLYNDYSSYGDELADYFIEYCKFLIPAITDESVQLSEKTEDFIRNNYELFDPFEEVDYSQYSDLINWYAETKEINKSIGLYTDTVILRSGYIVNIEETEVEEGLYLTFAQVWDYDNDQHYMLLYLKPTEFLVEDKISFIGVPVGKYSFENVSGGYTHAIFMLATDVSDGY